MIIRAISRADCEQVAMLHEKNIDIGLLSMLGFPVIKLVYESMVDSPIAFCFIAEHDNKIVGFVSGTKDLNKFYREFIKSKFFKIVFASAPRIIRPQILSKAFNLLFYTNKVHGLPNAEFLSMAVDRYYRSKSTAVKLMHELMDHFRRHGIFKFKSVASLRLSIYYKFYEIMGATPHSDITPYRGERWRVYIWEI